jgi:hypothetical protein
MSHNLGYIVAFVATLIPGLNTLPGIVQNFETRVFPVVSSMHVQDIQRFDDHVLIDVYGEKLRDCDPVSFEGYSSQAGVLMKSALSFVDDVSPGSSRPKGLQAFGTWEFELDDQPNATSVIAVIEHDCGFWNVRTVLGPWGIGSNVAAM